MPVEKRVATETPVATDRTVVRTERRGGNGFLYFVVGALVVAVGVIGFMYYENQRTTTQAQSQTQQKLEAIGNAADKLGDTVRDATRGADQKPQMRPALPPAQPAPAPAPQ
jgi:uncharacterized protein HemX